MINLIYKCSKGFCWIPLLVFCRQAVAQDTTAMTLQPGDSTNIIHLLNADELLGIQPRAGDSSQYQKLVGHVRLQQGQTVFTCDSALQNLSNNIIDAYGHIHINQADTINTYSDFLHYVGDTKIATLRKNVRMTDGQMILTTDLLHYDMNTHVGNYTEGGKLVNKGTVLTSRRGYYYADTKDVYFKTNVELTDPEYTLTTDTLLYNIHTRIATFKAPTTINTGRSIIHTSCGYYSTVENYAHLCDRSTIIDSTQRLTADSMNYTKSTGMGMAYGNVVWTDTASKMTLLANYAVSDQNHKTILATQKPLLIIARNTDSLYLAADTFFSGPLVMPKAVQPPKAFKPDSARWQPADTLPGGSPADSSTIPGPAAPDSITVHAPADSSTLPGTRSRADSLPPGPPGDSIPGSPGLPSDSVSVSPPADSIGTNSIPVPRDSAAIHAPPNSRPGTDSTRSVPSGNKIATGARNLDDSITVSPPAGGPDSIAARMPAGSNILPAPPDSSGKNRDTAGVNSDTAQLRFVRAYHHVRLFSDSLQGVSDSLYYSDRDSAFHFYRDPVLWTGNTQLTGDTIVLITHHQQASRLLLQQHAMIINQAAPGAFNQIKGNNVTGYFGPGNQLQWMEVDGNAESLYYAQDDNGAFVGVNHSTSAKIHLYFKDSKLNQVVILKDVDGTFTPPTKITKEEKQLKGFQWEEDRRPRSKTELME